MQPLIKDRPSAVGDYDPIEVSQTYRRIAWRLIAFVFACYTMAYLNRTNLGFAQQAMKQSLGFTDAVYGLAAGVFFIGYFLFEVPTNLILARIGVRRTLTALMIAWGAASAAMMFVDTPMSFYVLRFLLGAFQAGFLPGVIFYLTFWYPGSRRARMIAIFMGAVPVAGIVGGPLTGWFLGSWDGYRDLAGWQWMFLLGGLPTVLLGFVLPFVMADRPSEAKWLTPRQQRMVVDLVEAERPTGAAAENHHSLGAALRDPRVYVLAFIYFTVACGAYTVNFWLPAIVRGAGISSSLEVGLYSVIPYAIAVATMIAVARRSDRRMERRRHLAGCLLAGALGMVGIVFGGGSLTMSLAALSLAAASVFAAMPVFWAIPTAYLSGAAAAGGIAAINSIALLGGLVSPALIGRVRDGTGSLDAGLYVMAGLLVAGAMTTLLALPSEAPAAK